MMRLAKRLSVVLVPLSLASLLFAGCASSGVQRALTPNDRLRDQVRELERLVVELQRKATVGEVEVARLKERVVELEVDRERLEDQLAQRPEPSPTRGLSEQALPSVRPPTSGRVTSSDIDDPEPPPRSRRTADADPPAPAPVVVPRRAPEVTPTQRAERPAVEEAPSRRPPPAAAATPKATVEVPTAGQAIYDSGYTQYHRGQYVDAEASFLRFLEGYPNTDLSDNAQFWIGEARFARDDFRGALAAFREVINRHPGGNKVPDALVKSGAALEALGDTAGARRAYEEVQERFPTSPAALRAEERASALR